LSFTPIDPRAAIQFKGGETEALARLNHYFYEKKIFCLQRNEKRNGGRRLFFKILWLALGCISPRTIYDQVKKYEEMYEANDSTYWLVLNCCGAIFFDLCLKNTRLSFLVFWD
jgi:deoxyribodipyrimidine photo-lyase